MQTRLFVRKLVSAALLLAFHCFPTRAQTTEDAIRARLLGQPLYLRGFWTDNHLRFSGDGNPAKHYGTGTFTESGIDVHEVTLTPDGLRIDGERIGLIFPNMTPKRIRLHSNDYDSAMRIEIASPPDGDFGKALTAIFAPGLASIVPSLPNYWQRYATNFILPPTSADTSSRNLDAKAQTDEDATTGKDKPFHVGGAVKPPVILSTREPEFSPIAKALKASGDVEVHLWILPDGGTSHLSIEKAAGLGMDEKAIEAVSNYRFKPATRDGKPITVDIYVDVKFGMF